MRYTLGLKKLPFEQCTRHIIYVESDYDVEINNLIKLNYEEICDYYSSAGYEFCYIPWLTSEIESDEAYKYFVPYNKSLKDRVVLKSDFILDFMIHPENRMNIGPSLLFYHPDCIDNDYPEAENQFRGVTIDVSTFERSPNLKEVLLEILADIAKHRRPIIRFQKVSKTNYDIEEDDGLLYRVGEEDFDYDADSYFDSESKQLMEEIKERIERLNKKGINTYIIKRMIKDDDKQLSRLRITKDYRIFLPDYKNLEIKMTRLPKAVFFLFLNHPEGILFKYLPDYKDELMQIYKNVKGSLFDLSSAIKSIENVTDPLNNSINEKCARIREAFVREFDDHLAKNYYVDGKRGGAKKIALSRELVKWEAAI